MVSPQNITENVLINEAYWVSVTKEVLHLESFDDLIVKFLQDNREFLWFSFLNFSNGTVLFGPVSDASVLDRCARGRRAQGGRPALARARLAPMCCPTLWLTVVK